MSTFTVSRDVARMLPQMHVVLVTAKDLKTRDKSEQVTQYMETASKDALAQLEAYPNAQSHPRIALYRNTLKDKCKIQPKKFPQSNESLYKRLLKDKAPPRPINPLVDFYNAVSIKHGVTAGAFDWDDLKKRGTNLVLRLTAEGDTFRGLDAAEDAPPVAVGPGELAYAQDTTVLTRQLAWRQSLEGLVTSDTTNAVFVSEILGDGGNVGEASTSSALADRVASDLKSGLESTFDAQVKVEILQMSTEVLSVSL